MCDKLQYCDCGCTRPKKTPTYMALKPPLPVFRYTQATSRFGIQLELEASLSKALIEENGHSLVEIKNDA